MKYKLRMVSECDELYLEYFTSYESAYEQFVILSEDREFINYYQQQVTITIYEGYVGRESIHWEAVQKSTLFPDGSENTDSSTESSN